VSLLKKAASLVLLLSSAFAAAQNIPAAEASKHVGEQGTVCGKVSGTYTATSAKGSPTFIDFDKPYPNETFTAVIWERDKATVGNVPKDGMLCVKGAIIDYRGRSEIVLHSPADWSVPNPTLSNNNRYTNVDGQSVHSPAYSSGGVPAGATAQCADGTYSFSQHRQGTCSHHGGVARWLQ
jgi:Protein of unknown function (DUF3761)